MLSSEAVRRVWEAPHPASWEQSPREPPQCLDDVLREVTQEVEQNQSLSSC